MQKLIYNIQVRHFKKDEELFHTDDKGDCFYILLTGAVDLYLPNPALKPYESEYNQIKMRFVIESQKLEDLLQNHSNATDSIDMQTKEVKFLENEMKKKDEEMDNLGRETKQMTFHPGSAFGERGLQ